MKLRKIAIYMIMICLFIFFIGCDDNSSEIQGGDIITESGNAWIYEQDNYEIAFMFDYTGVAEVWRISEKSVSWTAKLFYEVAGNKLLFRQDRMNENFEILGHYTFPFFTYSAFENTLTVNSKGTGSYVLTKKNFYEYDLVVNLAVLKGNYQNPFDTETTIRFDLNDKNHLILNVYNIKGQKIKSLIDGFFSSGSHAIVYNGTDDDGHLMPDGLYFYVLYSDGYPCTQTMHLWNSQALD